MSLERERLQARITELEGRVASLQRRLAEEPPPNRAGLLLGCVCLAVLSSLFLVQQGGDAYQRPPREEVRPDDKKPAPGPGIVAQDATYQFVKIVDSSGRPCMTLGSDDRGGVLRILGRDGIVRLHLHLDADGGKVEINGNDGKLRTLLSVNDGGKEGLVSVHNDLGKTVAILVGTKEGGILAVNNADEKIRGLLGVEAGKDAGLLSLVGKSDRRLLFAGRASSDAGGAISVYGQDGNVRASMSTNADGGALDIYANDPKLGGAFLGVAKNRKSGLLLLYGNKGGKAVHLGELDTNAGPTGALYLYGENGQTYVNLEGDKDGGIVCVRNSRGQPGAYLWIDDRGRGGLLQLHAFSDGKARIVGGINNQGIGFLEGRNNAGGVSGQLQ